MKTRDGPNKTAVSKYAVRKVWIKPAHMYS